MAKHVGHVGSVRQVLDGSDCPSCGASQYLLMLRSHIGPDSGGLYARCRRCQTCRDIQSDDLLAQAVTGYP